VIRNQQHARGGIEDWHRHAEINLRRRAAGAGRRRVRRRGRWHDEGARVVGQDDFIREGESLDGRTHLEPDGLAPLGKENGVWQV